MRKKCFESGNNNTITYGNIAVIIIKSCVVEYSMIIKGEKCQSLCNGHNNSLPPTKVKRLQLSKRNGALHGAEIALHNLTRRY